MEDIELKVPEESQGDRIDCFCASALELDFSRNFIQKLIRNNNITVNGNSVRPNYRVKLNDCIVIRVPEAESLDVVPENVPFEIIYEDDDVAVINKPAGLVVHPGPGNWRGTLVNGLMFRLKNLSVVGGIIRPGIVHRLDKDTEGVMVIAKNDFAHQRLSEQFTERKVEKIYEAVVVGKPRDARGIIQRPIGRHPVYRHKMTVLEGGREAVTEFMVKKIWNTPEGVFSLLEILLHTGRTHQIRVHLSSMGMPIVADPIYSKKYDRFKVPHLLLSSRKLVFSHPVSGERVSFEIPRPKHIADFIRKLELREEVV